MYLRLWLANLPILKQVHPITQVLKSGEMNLMIVEAISGL